MLDPVSLEDGLPGPLQVPYLDQTIWFVPTPGNAVRLVAKGVGRGRIWTADELWDLVSIPSPRRADLERIVRLKLAFGAEIVDVESDSNGQTRGGDASD